MTLTTGRAPRAELRTLRLCTGVVGATTLAGTVATSYVIAQPARLTAPVTLQALTVVAVVLPLLAAVAAPWVSLRTLRGVIAALERRPTRPHEAPDGTMTTERGRR